MVDLQSRSSHVPLLFQVLQALDVLLNACNEEWSRISSRFVEKLTNYLNGGPKVENNDVLFVSLKFLINILNKW